MPEEVAVKLVADSSALESTLKNLGTLADSFGAQLTGALKGAIVGGQQLDDILRQIALNLASMALDQALKPLQSLAGSFLSGAVRGVMPFAKGGVPGSVVPFASGGVVSSPTYFPAGRNIGLMGEAGAEAILPLRRSADGRLGVAAAGGGSGPVNVVFNVSTPDIAGFRKSEAQVTGMLARAVSRGARSF